MTSRRWWRLVRIVALGLSLTTTVAALDYAGSLVALENLAYDQRVRYFQHWLAPPDNGIVHVLIDDQSTEKGAMGDWPWSRATFAGLLDEVVRDGAKQVAFDVVFEQSRDQTDESKPSPGDEAFARAIRDAAAAKVSVLLPVTLDFNATRQVDPILHRATEQLTGHLEMSPGDLAARLQVSAPVLERSYYGAALADAMAVTARRAVVAEGLDEPAALRKYLPNSFRGAAQLKTPELGKFREALRLARTAAGLEPRFQTTANPQLLQANVVGVPLSILAESATDVAYVSYLLGADGRVRTVPLAVCADGRLVPQFGLVIAALRLGVDLSDPKQFDVAGSSITLRPPGRAEIRVPVRVAESGDPPRPVGALMDIPLRGGVDWKELYAPRTDAFIPALEIWRVGDTERRLRTNLPGIVARAKEAMSLLAPDDPAASAQPSPDDVDAVVALGERAMTVVRGQQDANISPEATALLTTAERAALDPAERDLRDHVSLLAAALKETAGLRNRAEELRRNLDDKIRGKMLVFGWASTSQAADHVATSIHAECPGVVIHGAIANAILSGELWTHLPRGYALALTIVCGGLMTFAVALLTPWRAFAVAAGLLLIVSGGASVWLFDYANTVIGVAGPLTAIVVCWAAGTLVITLRERYDRALVTRRFQSYVDPTLVNYVIEHPEQSTLAGQSRELTVVFIDVAGFTTLTERLGEASIAILRQLMDAMVPIIRKHNGFVNKFLGDGIMFFYGAPRDDAQHARHAVQTVLEMQQALGTVNAQLREKHLPELGVRAGISTGQMLVGDAGSADASDYTVLGDAVNLASRLEGANKALGTVALATARTAELCGDVFLFAPMGCLQVVGKEYAVPVCEPLCALANASQDQRRRADALASLIDHIHARAVSEAVSSVDHFRAAGGGTKLCDLLHAVALDLPNFPKDVAPFIRLSGK